MTAANATETMPEVMGVDVRRNAAAQERAAKLAAELGDRCVLHQSTLWLGLANLGITLDAARELVLQAAGWVNGTDHRAVPPTAQQLSSISEYKELELTQYK
jgi:hypothetical protein